MINKHYLKNKYNNFQRLQKNKIKNQKSQKIKLNWNKKIILIKK